MIWLGPLLVSIGAVTGAFGAFFLKKGAKKFSLNIKGIFQKNIIIGLIFYAFGAVIGFSGLRFGELSLVYPFAAFGYIASTFISWKMLNEKISWQKILAIILIIMGLILIVQ